jgi:hypothetical protein
VSQRRSGGAPSRSGGRREPKRTARSGPPPWLLPVGVVVGLLVALAVIALVQRGSSPPAREIDGIKCETQEQLLFHIHAHLALYADGQPRTVPAGIGIPDPQAEQTSQGRFVVGGSCFYWLHSHSEDGVVHIESPVQRTFTLGNYFDIWGQPLSATQVGADRGPVTAYLNGQRFTGDPRTIPLTAHAAVQLDVGTDVPPQPYTFAPNL